jgi:hypothetical protein
VTAQARFSAAQAPRVYPYILTAGELPLWDN